MNTADILRAFATADLPPAESLLGEPTNTPGLFYHGSPRSDLASFEPQGGEIYLSAIPTYSAAVYAGVRGANGGGRLYEAELVTRNPITMPPGWQRDMGRTQRYRQRDACLGLRDQGFDCVITEQMNGLIFELVIFSAHIIRPRSTMEPTSTAACAARARFSNPVFCDRSTWARMDHDVLRRFRIDALIDPTDGEALALLGPINRAGRRAAARGRRTENALLAGKKPAIGMYG